MPVRQFHSWLPLFVLCMVPIVAPAQPPEAKLAEAYYLEGDYANAGPLYERLWRNETANTLYFSRVVESFLQQQQFDAADEWVVKAIRKEPKLVLYPLYRGKVWLAAGRSEEATAFWQKLVLAQPLEISDYGLAGSFFYQERQYELARDTYLAARRVYRSEALFAADLANVYTSLADYTLATEELLRTYFQAPQQFNLVKGQILQLYNGANARAIERALLKATQKHSNDLGLKELLQDFYLLTEAFSEALLQARSIDLLRGENGHRLYELAAVFQNNGQYALSNQALDYIINEYRDSPYYLSAFLEKAKNYELQAFERTPLDTAALRQAVGNYEALFKKFGLREEFVEALYRRANLYIFYLNELPLALKDLRTILSFPLPPSSKAEARLLEGDIYLLQGDYSQAKIAYLAIEEALKEGQAGAKAKFRLARLAYFRGDFEEAKARLNILKDNTSNDIANDAIQLLLVILDNTGLDSTTTALERFAAVQLQIYQQQYATSLPILDSLLVAYASHPLADDLYWEKASVLLRLGQTAAAAVVLDYLVQVYGDGIYGDDALFLRAEMCQHSLNQPEKAAELYLELLKRYPGSVFQVEARKRARQLRQAANPGQ